MASAYQRYLVVIMLCCLAEAVPDDMAKDGNSDSDWKLDSCDQELAAKGCVDDRLDNSTFDGNESIDEGTAAWAENTESGGCGAGASGWVDNSFKNVDVTDSRQNGPGPGNLPVSTSSRNTNRRSHLFTASVVVNTGSQERCECWYCSIHATVSCHVQALRPLEYARYISRQDFLYVLTSMMLCQCAISYGPVSVCPSHGRIVSK